MNAPTPLWLARREQEQAARSVRDIDFARTRQQSVHLDRRRTQAQQRLTRAMERVAALEVQVGLLLRLANDVRDAFPDRKENQGNKRKLRCRTSSLL